MFLMMMMMIALYIP